MSGCSSRKITTTEPPTCMWGPVGVTEFGRAGQIVRPEPHESAHRGVPLDLVDALEPRAATALAARPLEAGGVESPLDVNVVGRIQTAATVIRPLRAVFGCKSELVGFLRVLQTFEAVL